MSAAFDLIPAPDWVPRDCDLTPTEWAQAIFDSRRAPAFVKALSAAREVLAKVMGIPPGEPSMLAVDHETAGEAVIDTDDRHLHFAATVCPDDARGLLHLITVVQFKGWRGRVYFVPVRFLHDPISRAMMTGAVRRVTRVSS
jgi:hypothetical protein